MANISEIHKERLCEMIYSNDIENMMNYQKELLNLCQNNICKDKINK